MNLDSVCIYVVLCTSHYSIAKAVGLLIQAVFDDYRVVFLLTI